MAANRIVDYRLMPRFFKVSAKALFGCRTDVAERAEHDGQDCKGDGRNADKQRGP